MFLYLKQKNIIYRINTSINSSHSTRKYVQMINLVIEDQKQVSQFHAIIIILQFVLHCGLV